MSTTPTPLDGQIQWLETPDTDVPPEDEAEAEEPRPRTRISRIFDCPTCGWQASEADGECYRCGTELAHDVRHDPLLKRLGISTEEAPIAEPLAVDALPTTPDVEASPHAYLLRLRFERARLIQGFDRLASLEQVDLHQFDYQLDAARTVLQRMKGRALLADEVGLGKTIEAGLVMKELLVRRLARRVLVLSPASLTYQWQEELAAKFNERFEVVTQVGQWSELAEADSALVVMSLDRAKGDRHAPFLLKRPWDLIIIDEAHRLKNRSTVAYKFVKKLERRYMLMLTATPVHNDLTELYSLVDLLKPGQLGTLRTFRDQFVRSGNARSPENAPALRQLLEDVMIRNRRTHVGVVFPKRKAAVVHLDLPELERELYDDVTGFIRRALKEEKGAKHLRLGLMTLQRELCSSPAALSATLTKMSEQESYSDKLRKTFAEHAAQADAIGYAAKVDVLLDLCDTYPDKFLVFTEFRRSQDELLKALDESGISATGFHGGMNSLDKERAVRAFRDDVRVLVSTESGGEGRNLQFCHQLVNYDLPWNPMRVEQRIGRVHRLGQEHDVLVFNLSTRNTLEAYLLDLLVQKIRMFELVIGELDLIVGDVDRGEIRSFEEMVRDAWMNASDEIDLQVAFDDIGDRFEKARSNYLDKRVLNEDLFDTLEQS